MERTHAPAPSPAPAAETLALIDELTKLSIPLRQSLTAWQQQVKYKPRRRQAAAEDKLRRDVVSLQKKAAAIAGAVDACLTRATVDWGPPRRPNVDEEVIDEGKGKVLSTSAAATLNTPNTANKIPFVEEETLDGNSSRSVLTGFDEECSKRPHSSSSSRRRIADALHPRRRLSILSSPEHSSKTLSTDDAHARVNEASNASKTVHTSSFVTPRAAKNVPAPTKVTPQAPRSMKNVRTLDAKLGLKRPLWNPTSGGNSKKMKANAWNVNIVPPPVAVIHPPPAQTPEQRSTEDMDEADWPAKKRSLEMDRYLNNARKFKEQKRRKLEEEKKRDPYKAALRDLGKRMVSQAYRDTPPPSQNPNQSYGEARPHLAFAADFKQLMNERGKRLRKRIIQGKQVDRYALLCEVLYFGGIEKVIDDGNIQEMFFRSGHNVFKRGIAELKVVYVEQCFYYEHLLVHGNPPSPEMESRLLQRT